MATFSNTPINEVYIDTTSLGTAYTVPSGAYAEISIVGYSTVAVGELVIGGRTQISEAVYTFPNGSNSTRPGSDASLSRVIRINEGETIQLNSSVTYFTAFILEFAKA